MTQMTAGSKQRVFEHRRRARRRSTREPPAVTSRHSRTDQRGPRRDAPERARVSRLGERRLVERLLLVAAVASVIFSQAAAVASSAAFGCIWPASTAETLTSSSCQYSAAPGMRRYSCCNGRGQDGVVGLEVLDDVVLVPAVAPVQSLDVAGAHRRQVFELHAGLHAGPAVSCS